MDASQPNAGKKNSLDIYDYVFTLEEQLRILEQKNQIFRNEVDSLKFKYERLLAEYNEIRKTPYIIGNVKELLADSVVVKAWNGNDFVVDMPENLRKEIFIGSRVALTQRGMGIMKVLPKSKDPRASAMEIIERPRLSFKDIGGLHEEMVELKEVVILPLKESKLFEELGIEAPNGVLLHGAPGTGKTLLAKALAHESNATFISLIGSELVRKYIGEGAELVRDVFNIAEEKRPAIVFIDEIDAIAARRMDDGSGGDREVQRTLMQLLNEMDGFKEKTGVKILAATNRIDILDEAILRPGRFDRIIEVPLPNLEARKEIFRIHASKMKLSDNININELAELTENSTGADIKAICTEAGMFALREKKNSVSNDDFLGAVKKIRKEAVADLHKKMFS